VGKLTEDNQQAARRAANAQFIEAFFRLGNAESI